MGLPYYDLCPVILRPKLPEPARTNPQEVSETMKAYNLNEPQATAILSALRTDGFSLIQGYVRQYQDIPRLTAHILQSPGNRKDLDYLRSCSSLPGETS